MLSLRREVWSGHSYQEVVSIPSLDVYRLSCIELVLGREFIEYFQSLRLPFLSALDFQ